MPAFLNSRHMRKKMYKWHRVLSLIIALPVSLWAISGFMHPVMTNIRPAIATQFLAAPGIDTAQLNISLKKCLQQHHIDSFSNMHIVQMGGQQFYQVALDDEHLDIRYFSTRDGKLLKGGDQLYARFLAKTFLEGNTGKDEAGQHIFTASMAMPVHDCCMMATMNVMNNHGAKITGVEQITHFDDEYKYINRLLPAYKVSFDRSDSIRIYVETFSGRFGYAVDNKRSAFDTFFGICHTWQWMDALGDTKYYFMIALTSAAFLTTVLGLYIFFTTKTKRSEKPVMKVRRSHRYTSLVASLFTLMFTFSGGFHALEKVLPQEKLPAYVPSKFSGEDAAIDFAGIDSLAGGRKMQKISLCRMDGKTYWQVYPEANLSKAEGRTDLMKSMSAPQQDVLYISSGDCRVLHEGDRQYAAWLASGFSRQAPSGIVPVTTFTDEYGFVNKRLPVWKVSYAANDNERYYIETSTGVLSTRVRDKDLAEGYSFAFLHKHHFMDWAGKTVRDISTMFGAAMQVAMVCIGLLLYFGYVRRRPL